MRSEIIREAIFWLQCLEDHYKDQRDIAAVKEDPYNKKYFGDKVKAVHSAIVNLRILIEE